MKKDDTYQLSFIAPRAQILMVDDNSLNRKLFVSLLKKTQIKIATASGGKDALEMVQKRHFDLIFMDYLMPEMDGGETLKRMRDLDNNLCSSTPVIALTANVPGGSREYYIKMGFYDFLSKPIVAEKLEALIWNLLPKEYISSALKVDPVSAQDGESLPDIEGVDWEYARSFLKDKKILLVSLRDFYRNIDPVCQQLLALAENIDTQEGLSDYRICVHTLKSNAALTGILSVSELAKDLEYAAQDGEREKVRTKTPLLIEALQEMKEHLQVPMGDTAGDEAGKPRAAAARLFDLFDMLCFSMDQMDISGADSCMDRICSYSYEPELQKIVDRVGRKVSVLDYDGAKAEIESVRKRTSLM